MMLDYDKLWKPYSGGGKHSADEFIAWVHKQAAKRGIDKEAVDTAVHITFMELADGKTFNRDRCSCGCEGTNPNTEICHLTLRKAIGMDSESRIRKSEIYAGHLNAAILNHIENDNAAYLAENMPPEPETKPDHRVGALKNAWNKIWSPYR